MAKTGAKRHNPHKYHKVEMNGVKIWACALPDCTHYMPKHMEKMAVGKNSICWECESPIILGPDNMHMDHPKCVNCQLGISADEIDSPEVPLSDAMKNFLEGKS